MFWRATFDLSICPVEQSCVPLRVQPSIGKQACVRREGRAGKSAWPCCTHALQPAVFVLECGHAGVRAARVMRWEERLAALRDARRWRHALALALHVLAAARISAGLAAKPSREPCSNPETFTKGSGGEATDPDQGSSAGAAAPERARLRALPSRGDGRGADVDAVGSALVVLMLGFLDAALASASPHRSCCSLHDRRRRNQAGGAVCLWAQAVS